MKFVNIDSTCPMCHKTGGLGMLTSEVEVPYFGKGLETTLKCDLCGFRHADFMILSQKDPLRVNFRAEGPEDLNVRVIRSNSGTLRIPEIGFLAEPTPLSESYVSNVEGVLDRAKDILLTAMRFHGEDPEKRALLEEYMARWDQMHVGAMPFTIEIDDPFGNSAIIHERVEKRALTPEEVAHLKTGYIILDKDEIAAAVADDDAGPSHEGTTPRSHEE